MAKNITCRQQGIWVSHFSFPPPGAHRHSLRSGGESAGKKQSRLWRLMPVRKNDAYRADLSKEDISIWQRRGHFYLALTPEIEGVKVSV